MITALIDPFFLDFFFHGQHKLGAHFGTIFIREIPKILGKNKCQHRKPVVTIPFGKSFHLTLLPAVIFYLIFPFFICPRFFPEGRNGRHTH